MALQKVKDTMRTTTALDGSKLSNDSITLAKMAGGTDGQVITYDAAGDPVAIGPGTVGQVLTSAGANLPQTFADAGGGAVTQAKFQYYNNQYAVSSSTSEIAVQWASAGGDPVSSSYFDIIITPTSAAHDFWVSGYTNIYKANSTVNNGMTLHMRRDIGGGGFSTVAKVASYQMYYSTTNATYNHVAWSFLDRTANTTSAVTYRMYWYNVGSANSLQIGQGYAGIGVLELVNSIVS